KNELKLTKYVGSLSTALALTASQQQAASSIFLNAVVARSGIKTQIKASRRNVSNAVLANDPGGISQESATLGTLKAQLLAVGANAHSAFYQLLTPGQQQLLLQFRS